MATNQEKIKALQEAVSNIEGRVVIMKQNTSCSCGFCIEYTQDLEEKVEILNSMIEELQTEELSK